MAAHGNARAGGTAPGVEGALQSRRRDFTTLCPRQSRALAALLQGPVPREQLDRLAGCANGPDLVASLRRRGFSIACELLPFIDRDGRRCRAGIYRLTPADRAELARWQGVPNGR